MIRVARSYTTQHLSRSGLPPHTMSVMQGKKPSRSGRAQSTDVAQSHFAPPMKDFWVRRESCLALLLDHALYPTDGVAVAATAVAAPAVCGRQAVGAFSWRQALGPTDLPISYPGRIKTAASFPGCKATKDEPSMALPPPCCTSQHPYCLGRDFGRRADETMRLNVKADALACLPDAWPVRVGFAGWCALVGSARGHRGACANPGTDNLCRSQCWR